MNLVNNLKITLISTIYNEEKTIGSLVESILNQTRVPDEIIFLDSLSEDKTIEIINSFNDERIMIIEQKADMGTARNILITHATHDIIVATDGGCVLDKNWCEEITKPFLDPKIKVVGGVFKPMWKNFLEKCQAPIVCKPIEKINVNTFLPSSRSLAFRKEVWRAVGGYPKHRIGGEDTLFNLRIKEKGYRFYIAKKAIVYWGMRSPLKRYVRQFYLYAVGDAKQGNIPRMKTNFLFNVFSPIYLLIIIAFLFLIPIVSLIMFIPIFLYFFYQGIKVMLFTKDIRGFFYGIILSFIKRFAYMFGVWREWLIPYKDKYKNENYD